MITGSWSTHRDAVAADDGAWPAASSGVNLSNFRYAEVHIVLGGTTPSWDITPGTYDSTATAYIAGTKRTVSGSDDLWFTIPVYYSGDFYILCDGKSGTTPTITIYVRGIN